MNGNEVKNNQGMVDAEKHLALYRDAAGTLHAFSSLCTHQECDIAWNVEGSTWDCPCHGSKFTPDGHVITGPAIEPLHPASVDGK